MLKKLQNLSIWLSKHFPNLMKFTKSEILALIFYGVIIFTLSNIISPGIQEWGLTEYYHLFPSAQVKPFITVIFTPGNLSFQNHTIFIENPQNLTASSFAFYINTLNTDANQNTTITAHTAGGNLAISYPYGNNSTRGLYTVIHNIRPGDVGIINITLSEPSKIGITVTRTDARYCTEFIYYYWNIHIKYSQGVSTYPSTNHAIGNCTSNEIIGFLYTLQGFEIINYS